MWDIINPARSQTLPIKKTKGESITPGVREELVLPQITSASGKNRSIEVEERKQAYEKEEVGGLNVSRSSEISLVAKIRELEVMILDSHGELEKRIRQIAEEMPAKLQRELSAIQNRDTGMWKDIQTKTANLQEAVNFTKDSLKIQTGTWNDKLTNLQKKADETEMKLISIEKAVEKIQDSNDKKSQLQETQIGKTFPSQEQIDANAVKEQFIEERKKREVQIDDVQRSLAEVDARVRAQIGEVDSKLQRIQENTRVRATPDTPGKGKQTTTKGELEFVNSTLASIEKRVDEESAKRIKLEEDMLKYLDEKLLSVKEKQKQEEKSSLEREKKMLGNLQDGLVTINDIMKGTNEESGLKLTKVEAELSHNLEALTQLVDNTNRAFASDLAKHTEDLRNLKQKIVEVDETALSNIQSVSSSMQNEITKIEGDIEENNKATIGRLEDFAGEIQRHEKLVELVKSDLTNEMLNEKKLSDKKLSDMKLEVEKAHNYVRERTVMMKYEMDENKKTLFDKCDSFETTIKGEALRIDQQANKRIDEFLVATDERIREHTAKITETLSNFRDTMEANKKAEDEYIKQQGNSIKALCRAFTEREAAERKQAVDELGIRIAKRFTQLESDLNKRFLTLEVDVKNYSDRKLREMESVLHPQLILEKIINSLEHEDHKQYMLKIERELHAHIAVFEKVKAEHELFMNSLQTRLQKEINDRIEAVNKLKNETELQFISRDTVTKMMNLLVETNLENMQKGNIKNFENLKAKCIEIEKKFEENLKNLKQLLEKEIYRLDISVNEEVTKSVTNQIASTISLNTIESQLMNSVNRLDKADLKNKKELTGMLNLVKLDLEKTVASNVGDHLANMVAMCEMDHRTQKEVKKLEEADLMCKKELNTKIELLNKELSDSMGLLKLDLVKTVAANVGDNIANRVAMCEMDLRTQKEVKRLDDADMGAKKELNAKIENLNKELTNSIKLIKIDLEKTVASNVGDNIANIAAMREIDERTRKELIKLENYDANTKKDLITKIETLNKELTGSMKLIRVDLEKTVASNVGDHIANVAAMREIDERTRKDLAKLENNDTNTRKDLAAKIELLNKDLTGSIKLIKVDLENSVASNVGDHMANIVAMREIDERMQKEFAKIENSESSTKKDLRTKIEQVNKNLSNSMQYLKLDLEKTVAANVGDNAANIAAMREIDERTRKELSKLDSTESSIKKELSKKIDEVVSAEREANMKIVAIEATLGTIEKQTSQINTNQEKASKNFDDLHTEQSKLSTRLTTAEEKETHLEAKTKDDEVFTNKIKEVINTMETKIGLLNTHKEETVKKFSDLTKETETLKADQEKIKTKLSQDEAKEAKQEEESKKLDAMITAKIKEAAGNTDTKLKTLHEDTLAKVKDITQHVEALKTEQESIKAKLAKDEAKEAKQEEESKKLDGIIAAKIKEATGNTDTKITTMHEDTLVKIRDISQNVEAVKTEQGKLIERIGKMEANDVGKSIESVKKENQDLATKIKNIEGVDKKMETHVKTVEDFNGKVKQLITGLETKVNLFNNKQDEAIKKQETVFEQYDKRITAVEGKVQK